MYRSVDSLVRDLKMDSDARVRREAARVLIQHGKAFDDIIEAAMSDSDHTVRETILANLKNSAAHQAFEAFAQQLRSSNATRRVRAVENLCMLNDPRAIPVLHEALRDYEAPVRRAAAIAVGRIGGPESLGPLAITCQYDVFEDVRAEAERAIKAIQSRRQPPVPSKPTVIPPKPIW